MKIELPELRDGEHNAGLMLDEHGKPEYWLIEAPMPDESMHFVESKKWAANLGYRIASEREGRLMAANPYAGLPATGAFWLDNGELDSHLADIQSFEDGQLLCNFKGSLYRARAVRRVPVKECE